MYEYDYERFIVEGFPTSKSIFEIQEDQACALQVGLARGRRFLEMSCSSVFGFSGACYHVKDMSQSVADMMPTTFDSAICLSLLKDQAIDSAVTDTLEKVLLNARRPSGFYNYFLQVPDKCRNVFLNDVDDTALVTTMLYQQGHFSLEECRRVGENMLESAHIGPNGGIGCWLPPKDGETGLSQSIYLKRLLIPTREDIGCILTTLWFLATVGKEEEAESSVECLRIFLEEHCRDVDKLLKTFMIYYMDKYMLYFMISRYIEVSVKGRKLFGDQLACLLTDALMSMDTNSDHIALQIACCIIPAMKLGLHKRDNGFGHMAEKLEQPEVISNRIVDLAKFLLTQQYAEGYFPAGKIYRWNHLGHFAASKDVSTCFVMAALDMVRRDIIKGGKVLWNDLSMY